MAGNAFFMTSGWVFELPFGSSKDPAKTPVAFQKRAFPFRVDGVRGYRWHRA